MQAITLTSNSHQFLFFFSWKLKQSTLKALIFVRYWGFPLVQNSKFNNFLWVCWFLGKNLFNFVSTVWKPHKSYCHNSQHQLKLHAIICCSLYAGKFAKMNNRVIIDARLVWPIDSYFGSYVCTGTPLIRRFLLGRISN